MSSVRLGLFGAARVRRPAVCRVAGWCVAGALVSLCAIAAAADKRYRLHYAPLIACPAEDDVALGVKRYAPNIDFTTAADAPNLSISVQGDGLAFQATVVAEIAGAPPTERVVPAATCAEAVNAAVLVAAILVDPDAAVRGAAADSGAPPGTSVADAADPASPQAAEEPPATQQTTRDRGVQEAAFESEAPGASPAGDWVFGAAAQGGVTWGIAPFAAPAFSLGLNAEHRSRELLSPSIRLSAQYAQSAAITTPAGEAQMRLYSGRAAVCPLRLWAGRDGPWFGPCPFLELGHLEARGDSTPAPATTGILWAALGMVARAELQAGAFSAALEAGLLAPFARDRFYFLEGDAVHVAFQVPPLAALGNAELGVRFP